MSLKSFSLVIQGKNPITFDWEGNPAIHHTGGVSVHALTLTDEQMDLLQTWLVSDGYLVRYYASTQTAEQKQERQSLLAFGRMEANVPAMKCLNCYWYDPRGSEDGCTLLSVDNPTLESACAQVHQAEWDALECPLNRLALRTTT